VLGSLPGVASIEAGQYYAHPRNAFWPIMAELVGAAGDYEDRCDVLMTHGIAVWDVLAESVRPGSLDSAIRMQTAIVNDFDALFARQPALELICLNGRKAGDVFSRRVVPPDEVRVAVLPSTSPANAAMRFDEKLARWRGILSPVISGGST
jgi:hypoxanthine-DNA glycosylase